MSYAGHFPTKHFDLAVWQAMPVWPEDDHENCPADGLYRSTIRGRPIVFCTNWQDREWWTVRPVVRVQMGRSDA